MTVDGLVFADYDLNFVAVHDFDFKTEDTLKLLEDMLGNFNEIVLF